MGFNIFSCGHRPMAKGITSVVVLVHLSVHLNDVGKLADLGIEPLSIYSTVHHSINWATVLVNLLVSQSFFPRGPPPPNQKCSIFSIILLLLLLWHFTKFTDLIDLQVADDADDESDQPEVRNAQRELITKPVQPSNVDSRLEKQVRVFAATWLLM